MRTNTVQMQSILYLATFITSVKKEDDIYIFILHDAEITDPNNLN